IVEDLYRPGLALLALSPLDAARFGLQCVGFLPLETGLGLTAKHGLKNAAELSAREGALELVTVGVPGVAVDSQGGAGFRPVPEPRGFIGRVFQRHFPSPLKSTERLVVS